MSEIMINMINSNNINEKIQIKVKSDFILTNNSYYQEKSVTMSVLEIVSTLIKTLHFRKLKE